MLDALDSVGLRPDGRLLALNSYENRVYLVYCEQEPLADQTSSQSAGSSVVVKFYRAGRWSNQQILEEHRFAEQLHAAEVPVVAPLNIRGQTLHQFEDLRFAVFPRQGGRSPDVEQATCLESIGRFIGRLHSVGAQTSFETRPNLDWQSYGVAARQALKDSGLIAALDKQLSYAYDSVIDQALESVQQRLNTVQGPQGQGLAAFGWQRIHADCHPSNILWTEPQWVAQGDARQLIGGPHFVDLDDARTGPPVQDLWMLLAGDVTNNREQAEYQLGYLVRGYEQFREFDDACLALIEPLRTLRLIHYSAWLAQRWGDPAFPAAFPWFNSVRYWQDRILEMREQIAALGEPALRVGRVD